MFFSMIDEIDLLIWKLIYRSIEFVLINMHQTDWNERKQINS